MQFRWTFLLAAFAVVTGCGSAASDTEPELPTPESVSAPDDLATVPPVADDWPGWRGPHFDNVAAAPQDPPLRWSETENVIWKAQVPGRGHGSPCLWGERILLPTADDETEVQYLLCYDRAGGDKLWQTEVHRGGFMRSNGKGSHASSTPACDGRYVFMPFMVQGGIWLTALDLEGTIAWQEKLGDVKSVHGFAASPLVYKSLVIVVADSAEGSFMAAVHHRTGEVVWKIDRPEYKLGSYASPTLGYVAGRDQLLIHGPYKVYSYDPATGDLLWTCDGPSELTSNTMSAGERLVYASGGYPKKSLLSIRADGSGDVTDTHVVWTKKNKTAYVTSTLLADGLLYMVEDGGEATCFDAATGAVIWQAELDGNFSSSPVLAGGHVYIVNEAGVAYVFKAGRNFELVAQNDLGDGGFATPAVCGGRIYLRTLHHLYCLGKPAK
ncbi:MAG: PQQ-binding-like beta-propeller repeat protein [Planctomycetota bacterium]